MTELTPVLGLEPLELGEGPLWNHRRQELSVVDIFRRRIVGMRLDGHRATTVRTLEVSGDIGAALPLDNGGFVTCQRDGIFVLADSGEASLVCPLPVQGAAMRANDAKLAPDGSLWVGIMDNDATPGAGSLWRIWRDGSSECLLTGLTIPNGLDWWDDEFWFVDGPRKELTCYAWDGVSLGAKKGTLPTRGIPDGLSIDSRGTILLALWGEGRVDAIDRDGFVAGSFNVPAPHSTSLTFVGKALDSIVVTSAQFGLDQNQRQEFPHSGRIFTGRCGIPGRPSVDSWVSGRGD